MEAVYEIKKAPKKDRNKDKFKIGKVKRVCAFLSMKWEKRAKTKSIFPVCSVCLLFSGQLWLILDYIYMIIYLKEFECT